MAKWRVEEAKRLIDSQLAKELAETWARCGDEQCLLETAYDPALVGVGKWWLGPFTIGNRKLGEIPFFSLPPVATCPGFTKFCIDWCYAVYEIANWRAYVREAAAYHLSRRDDFPQIATRYLAKLPHRVVRIHVSGDFYDETYFDKWVEIAKTNRDKFFYTYTKTLELAARETPPNLLIHISADPYNYVKAVEIWNEVKRGFITYVYTPRRENWEALIYILQNTEATVLLFLNHVQHAPSPPPLAETRRQLREKLGEYTRRVVLDPYEFSKGPQCSQCGLCHLKFSTMWRSRTSGSSFKAEV